MKKFPFVQSFKLVSTHAVLSVFAFLIGTLAIGQVMSSNVGRVIFSVIASVIYFIGIYSTAYEIYTNDKKSYTKETPYKLKGLVLAVGLFVVSLLLYLLYLVTWKFMTINGMLFSPTGWINNLIFIVWTYPFNGFLYSLFGVMTWYGYLIAAVLPFVASFCGYFAGCVGFDLQGKLLSIVYEKKTEGDKK